MVFVSLLFLAAVFGFYNFAVDKRHAAELARTMALNMLVVLEIFYLFFIRNIYWATVLAVTAAQFAVTYLTPMQQMFGTHPVLFLDGVIIVAVGVMFFAIIEAEKQLRLTYRRMAAGGAVGQST